MAAKKPPVAKGKAVPPKGKAVPPKGKGGALISKLLHVTSSKR
jgi:hypothetical protein